MNTTSQSIVQSVVNSINSAVMHELPAPYIVMNDVFPREFYDAVMQAFDNSAALFKPWLHKGDKNIFFGSYTDRSEFRIPDDFDGKNIDSENTWSALKVALESPLIFDSLNKRFATGFKSRFGHLKSSKDVFNTLKPTMLVTKHQSGYYLGPHTDRYEKVLTCVFNFAEDNSSAHLGTAMYLPKEEGMKCKGIVHHNPAQFDLLTTTPFLPNTATIFFRDDRLFHGVEKLTPENSSLSERRNVQFNYWE